MAIFTAAEQTYADLIIDRIDPERRYFQHRLYRHHCIKVGDIYVKDLRIIDDRGLEDLVIVDNSILSFAAQLDNGVPICSFVSAPLLTQQPEPTLDQELLYLITYLEEIFHHKDMRVANRKTFQFSHLLATTT